MFQKDIHEFMHNNLYAAYMYMHIVCPLFDLPMNDYCANTRNMSTSGGLLVVECNEGCVLTQGKYLTCQISSIWNFKEAKPKCEGACT